MAAKVIKPEEQVAATMENKGQLIEQASNDEEQVEALSTPVEVVLLKNIRHSTGVHRKGEKIAVTEEESEQLIKAKLARYPE
ncbi:hypothetical protein D1872_253720 [compost metagenome]